MSHDHARFAEWDAAYVLGALSPADRRAFEEHLESCDRCARAIAEIAPVPGLLARVDPERAASLAGEEPDPDDAPAWLGGRDALLVRAARAERAERERRRTRGRWAGALAAAAVLVVAIAIALGGLLTPADDTRSAELVALGDAPLSASVELDPVAWGTRIGLECSYEGEGWADASGPWPYVLVVIDGEGRASEVGTWRAAPGRTARLSAATALDIDEIATVEIRLVSSDRVLMRADIGAR